MSERRFKFLRGDFGPLPVDLNHLTIQIRFYEDRVEAVNCLLMTANKELDTLELDANNLEVHRVQWCEGGDEHDFEPCRDLQHTYDKNRNKLTVRLSRTVADGEQFRIRTDTTCYPSDHLLEGIYRDTTPPGAPQQYMSQCQQWGFQRIMPILDDCRAKCTMTTTLEGDARYTHLISNGNVDRSSNPDGAPVLKPGDLGRKIITYRNPVPMAPYLFIACAGTWDVLVDSVTYPDGKRVQLEYLVPSGHRPEARIPMEILKTSVLWIARTQDYQYPGDVYRTICMNKSNFGGMENVGNTTIVTDAALIDEHTLDLQLLYAHAVIVHEFEHNQCGSETTMESPFDVWLNEAYTVDVERQFIADLFDPTFIRLQQVDSIRNPLLGPLAIEDGGHVGQIVREGFNDPDELIDAVTYVKAAEVIRMLRLLVGRELFMEGKKLYFERYKNGNANTDQFFACFEEVSGRSLQAFKRRWLYSIGYPKITATTGFDSDAERYDIVFEQDLESDQTPVHVPIQLALVDRDDQDIPGTEQVFELTGARGICSYEGLKEPPAYASINRDASYYGIFQHRNGDPKQLARQASGDPNLFSRVEAFRQLTDLERIRLLQDPDAATTEEWLNLYGSFLHSTDLAPGLKAYFLRIEEQPLNRTYATWYPKLVVARETLMKRVNAAHREELIGLFHDTATYDRPQRPEQGIESRFLKGVLLDVIAAVDTPETHDLILEHFRCATTATDRYNALIALNRSSSAERIPILERIFQQWHAHLSGYANYLRIVASGGQPDIYDAISFEKQRPSFDIKHPTWSRSLFVTMAANTKMIWTSQGISWIADTVSELAPINASIASRVLNTFQQVARLKTDLKAQVRKALEKIVAEVDEELSATISGQARAYLKSIQPE